MLINWKQGLQRSIAIFTIKCSIDYMLINMKPGVNNLCIKLLISDFFKVVEEALRCFNTDVCITFEMITLLIR